MHTATITWEDGRIGRSRNNEPVEIEYSDGDDLAEKVYEVVKSKLASRNIEVIVAGDTGLVACGFQVGAKFTINEKEQ